MRYTLITLLLCAVLVGLGVAHPVLASDYPTRPIRMHTMVGPGAFIDLLTRGLAERLQRELGQPVLVINTPGGAHGSVMASKLKRAKPDGYTLGVSATAAYTFTPHFMETDYKFGDFEFISLLGLNQSGIICHPDRPWKTLRDAFEWARRENRGLTIKFQGTDDRLAMERIAAKEGVSVAFMPSVGGPAVIAAVMGGHVDLGHVGAILAGYVKAGRVRLLAATPPERFTVIPDVPTLREQGWNETVEMYVVLVAPKGVPDAIIDRLEKAVLRIAEDEEFRKFITERLTMRSVPFGRDYAETYMRQANERFGRQAAEMKKK